MTIEPATLHDLADVAQLLTAQFQEHAITLDSSALNNAVRGAIEDPARGAFLVAREPSPVGVAYLAFTWTLEHGGRSAWLEELYVVPAMRSRGVGSRLLREAMAHARAAGAVAIDLEVDEDHARAAHLYAREGFHPHRRARWFARL
jgi:ribosomal protein S18 acetylase RimI-like enzyme